jgi:heme-degrading monooxygenase HmoA
MWDIEKKLIKKENYKRYKHCEVTKSESESDEYSVVSSWNSLHEGVQMCERNAGSHRFVKRS